MNNFTKEELEELLSLFDYIKTSPVWIYREGYHDNLELKIKIKLDDYCEHDWIEHVMPDDKIQLFCSKCNRCKE